MTSVLPMLCGGLFLSSGCQRQILHQNSKSMQFQPWIVNFHILRSVGTDTRWDWQNQIPTTAEASIREDLPIAYTPAARIWRQFCENQIQQSHNPATTQYGEDHFQRQKVKRIKWKTIRKKDTDQKKNKRQKCNWNRIIQPAPNMGRITSLLSLKAFASSDGKTENPRSFSRRAPHRLFFRPDFRQISCNELIVSQTSSPLSLWIFKTQIAKANIQYLLLRSNFDFS